MPSTDECLPEARLVRVLRLDDDARDPDKPPLLVAGTLLCLLPVVVMTVTAVVGSVLVVVLAAQERA